MTTSTKTSTKTIERELMNLDFPYDVLTKACELFNMLDLLGVPREPRRSKVKCYCIYQAYIELHKPIIPDPCYIGKILGLSTSESDLAISKRPSYKHGFIPRRMTASPQAILKSYLTNNMTLPDDIVDDMNITFDKILTNKPSLLQDKPKPIVAAFILCYSATIGLSVDKDDLTAAFYLEYPTIRSRVALIEDAVLELI